MSFVNKIKGWGQKSAPADSEPLDSDVAVADPYDPSHGGSPAMAPPDLALPDVDIEAAEAFDAEPGNAGTAPASGSIISAAVPSEIADFTETRLQGVDSGAAPLMATLPVIGRRPVAEQQRILLALLAIGLIGLIGLALYSFFAARGGSTQVGATGQAMMQSQRLAKSVSQAIVGSIASFPEVKESAEVLATNVRTLKAAAPAAVQEPLDAVVPLVDRAEKNAGVIVAQQKALTEVGQSLRAINRQSFDLLEAAEAILSMKLQRDVNPIEVSALSQVVMLTQRIGKSANEFLTAEGVNPEAVFLLDKDLKSFNEITKGLLEGSAAMGLPGTRDPAGQGAAAGAGQELPGHQEPRRHHPHQPARPELRARRPDGDRRRQRSAAQRPGDGAGSARERVANRRADDHPADPVRSDGGRRRLRLPSPLRDASRASAQRWRRAGASRPRPRSRKPSASTTPTRRRFFA